MPSVREINTEKEVKTAFASDTALRDDVLSIIRQCPESGHVFQRVIEHFDGRPHKRVKIEATQVSEAPVLLQVPDISFATPIRKKLTLSITKDAIQGLNGPTSEVTIPFAEVTYIAALPIPDKAQKQYNFCVFSTDCSVFTCPDRELERIIQAIPLPVSQPQPTDFVSAIPEPHRKHEPAVHVTCHRGSKEGYLFFLTDAIVYGFKRPVLLIPLREVVSIGYTSVLQRTFNLTVDVTGKDSVEFSMIDIDNYEAVDRYVRKYQLNDASMAEHRRAKPVTKQAAGDSAEVKSEEVRESEDDEEDDNFHDEESHDGSTGSETSDGEEASEDIEESENESF